ncbi:hypothetical protein [Sediminicola luteus]|uniref:AsmA-like C-terminal domain-containing protein n=1 Tax=Sediminicola luteus TaxID=319238 RepID=A0A2A4GC15_9FLAO|nr:hypothetical protein [Sediminicola luteus]PCE65993.1 hypothetical protein B7P33_01440 [Sediminicola luteus]
MAIKLSKKFWLLGGLVLVLVLVAVNALVSRTLEKKLTDFIVENPSGWYSAEVGQVRFRLLRGLLEVDDVVIHPKTETLDSVTSRTKALTDIRMRSLRISGIHILKALIQSKIEVEELLFDGLQIQTYRNGNFKKADKKTGSLDLDAIPLGKMQGVRVDQIRFKALELAVMDLRDSSYLFRNDPLDIKTSGFEIIPNDADGFRMRSLQEQLKIGAVQVGMDRMHYNAGFSELVYDFAKGDLLVKDLVIDPQKSNQEMAALYPNSKDVVHVKLPEFKVHGLQLARMVRGHGVYIDSIGIHDLELQLYKDKGKPFHAAKTKKLPHLALQQMTDSLRIEKVKVQNASVLIQEKLAKRDTLLTIDISRIVAELNHITTITPLAQTPMRLNLDGVLMQKAPLELYMEFPLQKGYHDFSFRGSLGAAQLCLFDSALFPAIGLKVLEGDLDSMTFKGTANATASQGSMIMLYHDLEAHVFKVNSLEENKFLSWAVNTLVKKANPTRKKKARVAVMHFKRDPYKSVGNYLWKSILSGITNTMAPGGKTVKSPKKKPRP